MGKNLKDWICITEWIHCGTPETQPVNQLYSNETFNKRKETK